MLFTASLIMAEDYFYYQPDFGWKSPIVMAQGGSFVANANGFDSLIYNPCGYIGDKGDFYISIQGQGLINLFTLYEDIHADEPAQDILINQLVTNGFGGGAKLGFGWVGRGIGAAFIVNADSYFPQVDNPFSAKGMVYIDAGLIGGYAHNFKLGAINLGVGGTARVFYRWESNVKFTTITDMIVGSDIDFNDIPLLGGMSFGFDAGVNVNWESLTGSVVFRNIGHQWYFFRSGTLGGFLDEKKLPSDKVNEKYVTPMNMGIGFDYHPDLGKNAKIIDPRIHLSYEVPLLIGIEAKNYIGYEPHSFWMGWHVGAELKLVNVFIFRAGINQGYLTAGTGIDFYIGELSVAIFSQEGGRRSGASQELGCSVELLFRF
jgi:hypothetical protein